MRRKSALIARIATVVVASATWLVSVPPAHADEPLVLETEITDRVGALGDRAAEVEAAQDRLFADYQLQLFVVYVDDFSGFSAQDWADTTAVDSGMGINDVVLAVATDERTYAISVDPQHPLTDTQLAEVESVAIEPALRENDWAGAAVGGADGLGAAMTGEPVQTPEITPGDPNPSAGSGAAPWLIGGAAVVGVGVAGWALARRSGKRRSGDGDLDPARMPLDELDRRAGVLLVETDDAVKTSEQEVGFAEAQFGPEAAAPFAAAVDEAKTQLSESFRLRQRLDDSEPEDEATRRAMLTEIIQRCEAANDRLDAESAAFERLRDLEKNAPRVLATVHERVLELADRLEQARTTLRSLADTYAESALAPIAANPDEAASRLEFTRTAGAEADIKIEAGATAEAAVRVQAAELAVGQAAQLLDAIDAHAGELEKAATGVRGALADIGQDLAEAEAVAEDPSQAPSAGDLAGPMAAAKSAVIMVEEWIAAGRYDPLAAMRRLHEAGGALDRALSGVRDAQARAHRARASLEQALLAARSEIAATTDFITTRRGGVGSEARTRLVEAQRHLDQAMGVAQSDPESALSHAQQADSLAEQAGQLARRDVGAFDTGGAGLGGRSSGMGGAILGGILGGLLSGGGRGSSRGSGISWNSARGSAWGGRRSSSSGVRRTGGGSRGRRGGSGRF